MWRSVAGLALLLGVPAGVSAQTLVEWQVHGVGRFATSTFVGGGLGFALRSAGRERLGLSASAGSLDGALAGRLELTAGYYLNPGTRDGASPYAAGGIATEFLSGSHRENIVLTLGVESSPGGKSGWFLEAGVASGVRAAAGIRLRRR